MLKIQGKSLLILVFLFAVTACGVKSDPIAPETPAEIGKGKPKYNSGKTNSMKVTPTQFDSDTINNSDDEE